MTDAHRPTRPDGPAGSPGPEPVADFTDPRLADYARLTDVGHRVRREPAAGVFIAEGEKVARRAMAAGYAVRSLLLAPNRVGPASALAAAVRQAGAPVYVADRGVLEHLTGYHVHRGLLAAMDRRPLPAPADLLAGARRVTILEDVVDHTNVGAAFRSAAAFGVDAVLVTPRCADPLYRRSIRTSMGTVFQVPWTRLESWPADLDRLHGAGWVTVALTPDPAAVPLPEFAAQLPDGRRVALILGAEGDGLRRPTVAAATVAVSIPMAAGVDSLNVAAAAAVAFYATR